MCMESRNADVMVIGGGIAGLGAAVRLKDRGLEPLVLEAEPRERERWFVGAAGRAAEVLTAAVTTRP